MDNRLYVSPKPTSRPAETCKGEGGCHDDNPSIYPLPPPPPFERMQTTPQEGWMVSILCFEEDKKVPKGEPHLPVVQ